jgi:large subunit ribosomal protein L2
MENRIKVRYLGKVYSRVGGRNSYGRITLRYRGGGTRFIKNNIDNKRILLNVPGRVFSIQRDAGRSGFIGLIQYSNGYFGYVLLAEGMRLGDYIIQTNTGIRFNNINRRGSSYLLKQFYEGEVGYNLEYYIGGGGKIARAAGTKVKIIKKYSADNTVLVKLPSGEFRLFNHNCRCTVGIVSNIEHRYRKFYKAGQNRWLGFKPHVRGEAMNPVDHPHGGRTKAGRVPVTPWGMLTKGVKTRNVKNINKYIIKNRLK